MRISNDTAMKTYDPVQVASKIEARADELYSHYRTFDRAIVGASRDLATAKTLIDVEFHARVLVLLANTRDRVEVWNR